MATPKQLQDYYQIINPKDLIGGFKQSSVLKNAPENKEIYEKAMELIVNSGRTGAYTFDEMISKIKEFVGEEGGESVHNVIKIYSDTPPPGDADYGKADAGYAKISKVMAEPQDSGTKVGVVLSHSPYVSFNLRHMNHVTTFLTAMPTIELSRAVPFVDVNFQFRSDQDGSGALTAEGRHRVPSLIKFLEGAIKAEGASKTIVESYDKTEKGTNQKISEIDMGIFTAPQTLVNPDLRYDPKGGSSNTIAAEVGDRFRPLASLQSIHIDVVASPSYTVAYKWMKMELILHDRTRLAEIANLIRPAVYTNTSLVIRYGWSHPDNSSNNAYAELINQMRVEERYAIKNASYSFDDVGQVKINLELSQLGENQLWLSRISESEKFQSLQAKIESVRDRIFNLIQDLGIPTEADTRAYQIMNFVDNSTNSDVPDKEINEKISKFISSVKAANPGAKKALAQELSDLLEGKVKDRDKDIKGLKEQLKNTVLSSMEEKYKGMQENPDPFLPNPEKDTEKIRYAKDIKGKITKVPGSDKKRYGVSSLAKIMTLFVLQPLRQTGKFDEVQIVYYPFNDYCGNAGGTNIGQFPIDIGTFKKVMENQVNKKGMRDMTVAEFGKLLNDAFIADPSAIAYGMSNHYVGRTGVDLPKPKPNSNIESAQDALLGATGAGGVWKNPTVEFYLECLTKNNPPAADRDMKAKTGDGAILRIHVYDKQSTPWDGFMKLKSALSRINSSTLKPDKNSSNQIPSGKKQIQQGIADLKEALALGGASFEEKDGVITLKDFNVTKIKKLISSFVPTLTYGTNNTGILKANLQSIQDPRLSTVNQLRQNAGTSTSPNGTGVSGLPLRVIPGQIQMMLLGCPLMSINQQFFIDFGTNTDLDNFYALTGLTHTISQGKFETSAKFIWMDAYGSYENISTQFKQLAQLIKKASE